MMSGGCHYRVPSVRLCGFFAYLASLREKNLYTFTQSRKVRNEDAKKRLLHTEISLSANNNRPSNVHLTHMAMENWIKRYERLQRKIRTLAEKGNGEI